MDAVTFKWRQFSVIISEIGLKIIYQIKYQAHLQVASELNIPYLIKAFPAVCTQKQLWSTVFPFNSLRPSDAYMRR